MTTIKIIVLLIMIISFLLLIVVITIEITSMIVRCIWDSKLLYGMGFGLSQLRHELCRASYLSKDEARVAG